MDSKTEQILLDSLHNKAPRQGSPLDIWNAFVELYHMEDPIIHIFMLFMLVFMGIPTIGGICIIIYRYHILIRFLKETEIPRARSYLPFLELNLEYFKRQKECCRINEFVFVKDHTKLGIPVSRSQWVWDRITQLIPIGTKETQLKLVYSEIFKDYFTKLDERVVRMEFIKVVGLISKEKEWNLVDLAERVYIQTMIGLIFGSLSDEKFKRLYSLVRELGTELVPQQTFKSYMSFSKKQYDIQDWIDLVQEAIETSQDTYLKHIKEHKDVEMKDVWKHILHQLVQYKSKVTLASWTLAHLFKDQPTKLDSKELTNRIQESWYQYAPVQFEMSTTDYIKLKANGTEYTLKKGTFIMISPALIHQKNGDYDHQKWNKVQLNKLVSRGDLVPLNIIENILQSLISVVHERGKHFNGNLESTLVIGQIIPKGATIQLQ